MFDIFIVISRELAEALLIVAALRLLTRETHRKLIRSPVVWSAVLGGITGLAVMTSLASVTFDARLEAIITLVFGLSVLLTATSTLASANSLYGHVENTVDTWLQRLARGPAVIGIAFLVTFRETLEVVVFLKSLQIDLYAAHCLTALALVVLVFTTLIIAFRSITARKSLLAIFRFSALLLAFVAIRLLLAGLQALLEATAPYPLTQQLSPFFSGGAWHAYLVTLLMIPVLGEFISNWWKEGGPTVLLDRE